MTERTTITHDDPMLLAKRALFLAWKASRVVGMGVLQDRGEQPEKRVVEAAQVTSDAIHADYVFGRMMKLHLFIEGGSVSCDRNPLRSDYQSWIGTYPSYRELIQAAESSLMAEAN